MTVPVGGIRKRLIKHSFEVLVNDILDGLGWFEDGRGHKPVTVIGGSVDDDGPVEVSPNIVSIAAEDINTTEWEMGTSLEEVRWDVYIDIYAENDSVGLHLASDLMDGLKGKMSSIDRYRPHLLVQDYRQATPTDLFYCQLESIDMAKVRNWQKKWQKHWFAIGLVIVDYYTDEDDEDELDI
jgi:hypothetical protein